MMQIWMNIGGKELKSLWASLVTKPLYQVELPDREVFQLVLILVSTIEGLGGKR